MRLPIAGARPIIFSSVLDGPNSCSHASATTCGAIISGSTKQKTNALRPRISVSADEQRDRRRRSAPRAACRRMPSPGCAASRSRSSALDRTRVSAAVENRAAGRDAFEQQPRQRQHRQDRDDRDQAPTAARSPRRARASLRCPPSMARRAARRRHGTAQLPKSSAKRFRLALLFCTTLRDVGRHQLDLRSRPAATTACRRSPWPGCSPSTARASVLRRTG